MSEGGWVGGGSVETTRERLWSTRAMTGKETEKRKEGGRGGGGEGGTDGHTHAHAHAHTAQ